MRGFSKAIITGNVTRDPETRSLPSGSSVTSFSVAVNRVYKDANGQNQESVSFIDCVAWGRTGEVIAQYGKKGSGILVSGRLDQRSWEDKNTGQKRSRVEVVVEDFNFIGGAPRSGEGGDYGNGGGFSNGGFGGGNFGGGNAGGFENNNVNNNGGNGGEVVPDDIPQDVDVSEIPF